MAATINAKVWTSLWMKIHWLYLEDHVWDENRLEPMNLLTTIREGLLQVHDRIPTAARCTTYADDGMSTGTAGYEAVAYCKWGGLLDYGFSKFNLVIGVLRLIL